MSVSKDRMRVPLIDPNGNLRTVAQSSVGARVARGWVMTDDAAAAMSDSIAGVEKALAEAKKSLSASEKAVANTAKAVEEAADAVHAAEAKAEQASEAASKVVPKDGKQAKVDADAKAAAAAHNLDVAKADMVEAVEASKQAQADVVSAQAQIDDASRKLALVKDPPPAATEPEPVAPDAALAELTGLSLTKLKKALKDVDDVGVLLSALALLEGEDGAEKRVAAIEKRIAALES